MTDPTDQRGSRARAARTVAVSLVLAACGQPAHGTAPPPAHGTAPPEVHASPDVLEGCAKLVVGSAREAALLCKEVDIGYWHVTHQVVTVVRAGRRVPVLRALTKIEGDDDGANWLELRLTIAADGMSASLDGVPINPYGPPASQPGPFEDCDIPSDWKDSETERLTGKPKYLELRRRLCSARGGYQWRGGRFLRAR